ncbi:hypothetical protein ACS0TY_004828 [Phlomoides rotata]
MAEYVYKSLKGKRLSDVASYAGSGSLLYEMKCIAGICLRKRTSTIDKIQSSWEIIAENVNSVVDSSLDKILSLSYTLLPHHLRPCFLFMGGFPEDKSALPLVNLQTLSIIAVM